MATVAAPEQNRTRSATRVILADAVPDCEKEFLTAVARSGSLHSPWAFPPHTHEQYEEYMARIRSGRKIGSFLRRHSDQQLVGVVNVSEPVMGAFCSAYLGFYAFSGFERQGHMTAGLALVLDRAFRSLGFHRLEANIQPGNVASTALVSRLRFRREGFSPRYLQIDGAWRDHDRWAILSDEWWAQRERIFASSRVNKRKSRNAK